MPETLVASLRRELAPRGLAESDLLVRISMGADLPRVRQFGTSRAGRSDMLWDRLAQFRPEQLPRFPILHEDVVIASLFEDLDRDAALTDGTLAHKLTIYEQPFITVYDRRCFVELMHEGHERDPRNHGRHWLFTVPDKRKAVVALLAITRGELGYLVTPVEELE